MSIYRTNTCGELSNRNIGEEVYLSGWVNKKRDHGGLLFIDLRDHYGITQCVFDSQINNFVNIESIKLESVIKVKGKVIKRSDETINKSLITGEIEIFADSFEILNSSLQVPFQVAVDDDSPEELRLKFRYLDLRRDKIHNNIVLRSNVIKSLREKMINSGFQEIQTPILTASSPEGARDFLVPSRLNKGKFYALPQAPQIFKQLLMVSNFDKYFQIAPCFRDEDARADRSPGEFYQLDFEMSFVEQEDIFKEIEPIIFDIFNEFSKKQISKPPFKKISYKESMSMYGTDKPDLRNPLRVIDVTNYFIDSGFKIFESNISNGSIVKGIVTPKSSEKPRAWFDKLNNWARENGQKGLGYIIFSENNLKGPIASNLKEKNLKQIVEFSKLKNGDSIFFICDEPDAATKFSGIAREKLCKELDLLKKDSFEFCWIVDYPMYEINENSEIDFSHNPFSMPQGGMNALQNKDPLEILAYQFDIVCNGIELSSGAIRNHKPEIMIKAFEIAGYSESQLKDKFGFLFDAFQYGAPPHGGSAPGIDRMVMLLAGEENLREIVAFPMNQRAEDLMLGSPNKVSDKHLKELGLTIKKQTT